MSSLIRDSKGRGGFSLPCQRATEVALTLRVSEGILKEKGVKGLTIGLHFFNLIFYIRPTLL
jgi:hypothetical protein